MKRVKIVHNIFNKTQIQQTLLWSDLLFFNARFQGSNHRNVPKAAEKAKQFFDRIKRTRLEKDQAKLYFYILGENQSCWP